MKKITKNKGFTFTELLVVIAIIAILGAGAVLVLNPGEQIARARDNQREAHINAILHAVEQKIFYDDGQWVCEAGPIPGNLTYIGSGEYNLYSCIYPKYLSDSLFDPQEGNFESISEYYTAYQISQDSVTGRISLNAPHGETKTIYLGKQP